MTRGDLIEIKAGTHSLLFNLFLHGIIHRIWYLLDKLWLLGFLLQGFQINQMEQGVAMGSQIGLFLHKHLIVKWTNVRFVIINVGLKKI